MSLRNSQQQHSTPNCECRSPTVGNQTTQVLGTKVVIVQAVQASKTRDTKKRTVKCARSIVPAGPPVPKLRSSCSHLIITELDAGTNFPPSVLWQVMFPLKGFLNAVHFLCACPLDLEQRNISRTSGGPQKTRRRGKR